MIARSPVMFSVGGMLLILGLVVAVYAHGLNGPFLFDDRGNIVESPGIHMKALKAEYLVDAALSRPDVGYIHRPLPRISFALNYYFGGKKFDRWTFKATNLAVHLINAGLVFFLSLLLLRCLRMREGEVGSQRFSSGGWVCFPLVVAAIWALHPIQLTSVLYVVQRMTSMAGTAVLLGLILFVAGRLRYPRSPGTGLVLMAAGVVGGTTLGVLCKENAALTPFFAFLIEVAFFPRRELSASARFWLRAFYATLFALVCLAGGLVLIAATEHLTETYLVRNFGAVERLLTESRVLFYYLGLLFFPNLREFSLFHDDFVVSTGLLTPPTTLLSLLAWALLAAVALWGFRRQAVLSFGILWYLVGHSVESSILGLELVHEHRNYLPILGPVFAGTFYVFRILDHRPALVRLAAPVGLVLVGVLAFVTHTRASVWESLDSLTFFSARNHPGSYRAQLERGNDLERRGADVQETYAAYRRAAAANPHAVVPVVRMQRLVSGLLHHLSLGPSPAEMSPAETLLPTDLLRDDLKFGPDSLMELDRMLAEEIHHRISRFPVNAETMYAMRELRQCLVSGDDSCPPASRVDGWLEIAIHHERVQPIQKAGLLLTRSRLYAYQGDIEQAVAFLEEAYALSSEEVGFLIELASLYRVLQDYDRAEQTLGRIQLLVERTGRRSADFHRLQKYIRLEREQYERERQSREGSDESTGMGDASADGVHPSADHSPGFRLLSEGSG